MSTILFSITPITGHIRPALPIARELLAAGHTVYWYTGAKFADLVTATGATVVPMTHGRDVDDAGLAAWAQEHGAPHGGLSRLRWDVRHVFVEPIPGYIRDLEQIVAAERPDVIVSDAAWTAGPLVGLRHEIPNVIFTVSPLNASSIDTAPFGTGLPPSSSALGRLRNRGLNWALRRVVFGGSQRAAARMVADVGLAPLDGFLLDWSMLAADRFLHASVPELEYPRTDLPDTVEFIGALLPTGVDRWQPPAWWGDVAAARADGRPVVLVTQGTVATDLTQLVLPTIEALALEDALVLVATDRPSTSRADGGLPDDVLPVAARPANLRVASFLPFTEVLDDVDVLVTNGGFGGVQLALSHGVPLVVAGRTEDKLEVNARVSWAGVGISLGTERPTSAQVARGVQRVLANPGYLRRADAMAQAYTRYRGAGRAAEVIAEVAQGERGETPVGGRESAVASGRR